ncbi:MAG: hypothetical protein R2770_08520 [Acidimicrobiales bacterium]
MRRFSRVVFLVLALSAMVGSSAAVALGNGSVLEATSDWGPGTDALTEQVAVHGTWSLRVAERGEIVQTVRFTNDLTDSGADTIARLISGEEVAGLWAIALSGSSPRFCTSDGGGCFIHTPGAVPWAGGSSDLVVEVGDGKLRLDGSLVVEADGTIDSVRSQQFSCPAGVGVERCRLDTALGTAATLSEADFTAADLAPLTVRAGQRLIVSVVISFG